MFLETQQNTAKDLTPMPDQFEHYITQNIKAFYKRRLLTPILYLIFLLVLWFVLSLSAPPFRTRSMPRIPSRAPTDGMKNTYPPPYPI